MTYHSHVTLSVRVYDAYPSVRLSMPDRPFVKPLFIIPEISQYGKLGHQDEETPKSISSICLKMFNDIFLKTT